MWLDLLTFQVHDLGRLPTYTARMYLLTRLPRKCQEIWCRYFVIEPLFLWGIIKPVTVSLGRLSACSIWFIFRLGMDSNTFKISTNKCVVLRFFARTPLMIRQIVRICEVVGRFLRKPWQFFRYKYIVGE